MLTRLLELLCFIGVHRWGHAPTSVPAALQRACEDDPMAMARCCQRCGTWAVVGA